MRNFLIFIRRFFNLILFLAIEIVCIALIARTNTLQGNDLLSSANMVSGILYQKREDMAYYFSLKRMNETLVKENAALRQQLALSHSYDLLKDSSVTRGHAGSDSAHTIQYADYTYRNARVVNNSVAAENNYITINRGSDDGIRKNMAVVSATGAVGEIVDVSAHFSTALSMLSIKRKVSAKIADGTLGSVKWDESDPDALILEDIPQQVKTKIGDSVFTTSYSFFPPDILIGTVSKKKLVKKNNLQLLYLKPATNFRNLQYVYVVENKMLKERRQLEDSTKHSR